MSCLGKTIQLTGDRKKTVFYCTVFSSALVVVCRQQIAFIECNFISPLCKFQWYCFSNFHAERKKSAHNTYANVQFIAGLFNVSWNTTIFCVSPLQLCICWLCVHFICMHRAPFVLCAHWFATTIFNYDPNTLQCSFFNIDFAYKPHFYDEKKRNSDDRDLLDAHTQKAIKRAKEKHSDRKTRC